ncbi:MAG: hypothetical protein M1817_001628 [Caeruleum heppii]|nr:MAG: hypothetical protein M1817_001628 [Caeruleum heppii]
MPEIGEVARVVHYLRKFLVGKVLSSVKVQADDNVYGKVGTTAEEFQKAMRGKKVLSAGMTGWIKFSNEDTLYYKPTTKDEEEWPPKYWKFLLQPEDNPKCEAAFVDSRRFARVRLVDCDGGKIRQVAPLNQNGPDPVQDQKILTKDWFVQKVRSKKLPIKAFLLDQGNISGIGNWVGDEILYHAKVHPEQYTQSLSVAQLEQLHTSMLHVCSIAVETMADQSQFPKEWLMTHRWGKGKKDNKLPNGEKIVFFTVGGRTSAVVPTVQKKTGPVAGDIGPEAVSDDASESTEVPEAKPNARSRPKTEDRATLSRLKKEQPEHKEKPVKSRGGRTSGETAENKVNGRQDQSLQSTKKRKAQGTKKSDETVDEEAHPKKSKKNAAPKKKMVQEPDGRRRSARTSGRGVR